MKLLILACFTLILSTLALAEQKLNLNIPGGGAQDLLNMTSVPRSISDHGYDPTMTRSCTNRAGRVVHQGDPEFQHCIDATEGIKTGSDSRRASPNADPVLNR